MIRSIKYSLVIYLLFTATSVCFAQDRPVTLNQFELTVKGNVVPSQQVGSLRFSYSLTSSNTSKQKVRKFYLIMPDSVQIRNIIVPQGWFKPRYVADHTGTEIYWSTHNLVYAISPGQSLDNISFEAAQGLGIITFYSEGWGEIADIEKVNLDSLGRIIGYDDLTPYGPGIVGKTVGPVLPPTPFVALTFLDTLISYATQSRSLGWITTQAAADKYLDYFNSARTSLQQNNIHGARTTLQQVLNDVNVDSTSNLTSEAYALIRYNTEYLLNQLPATPPPTISVLAMIDSLIVATHRAHANGWLGDKNFVNELNNHLENARKHLVRGDSTNTFKEVEKFQEKIQKEYEKTVNNEKKNKPRDKRFVTVEGWKFLFYNAQYILDRLPKKK